MIRKVIFAAALLLILPLAGCNYSPKNEGEGYALRAQADIESANAAQAREIARENQDWVAAKRAEKAEFWASVESVAQAWARGVTVVSFVGLGVFAAALTFSLAFASVKTAQAYGDFVTIRARLIHPDRVTGLRPLILWPESGASSGGLLERFTVRHVRGTRWFLMDSMTGACGVVDEARNGGTAELEVMRQALLAYQTSVRQERSGKSSPEGQVAEAIGQSNVQLPDAGRVLLDAARENLEVE